MLKYMKQPKLPTRVTKSKEPSASTVKKASTKSAASRHIAPSGKPSPDPALKVRQAITRKTTASPALLPLPPLFDHAKLATLLKEVRLLDINQPRTSFREYGTPSKQPASPTDALLAACRALTTWVTKYEPRAAASYHRSLAKIGKELTQVNSFYLDGRKLEALRATYLALVHKIARECRNVFVVHGRDDGTRIEVQNLLTSLRIPSVSLARELNEGRFILTKFEHFARQCQYAIILCTPDDSGALNPGPRKQPDPASLRPRARQNVVLELGYFFATLTAKNLFVLHPVGDFEAPSDYHGLLNDTLDAAGLWRRRLVRELQAAGFAISDAVFRDL